MSPLFPTKTLILDSSTLFISSYKSFSALSSQTTPPTSFNLLSVESPLPPIPPNFPQSKIVPKTRFVIDGFKSSGDFSVSYFLSHFHADHYAGLGPAWSKGMIFCSDTTARLLVEILKVTPLFVVSLTLNESVKIDGCDVTLIDANHCPGAVQFLFKVQGERYVHTGDFRFCNSMRADSALKGFVGADAVFLDTTYCHPKWVFPLQDESIEYVAKTIERIRTENKGLGNSILFLVSTYVVGKERILLEISRRCDCLLHVDGRKMEVLRVLGFADCGFFTEDASGSDVHVIGWNLLGETWPYFRPNFVKMKEIMVERGYSKAVGFVPTGWMYGAKKDGFAVRAKDSCEIHLIPYSEHSSYDELRDYVRFLKPKRVIPTVGLDVEKLDSKHAASMQKHFVGLVDEMANKHEFLMGFHRKLLETDDKEVDVGIVDSNRGVDMENEDNTPSTDMENVNGLEDSIALNEKYIGLLEELQDCLPKWVTREQMLDLLTGSHGDIVEAVSDFYEHETELHEQAIANTMSVTSCQKSLCKDSSSLPEIKSINGTPNEKITTNQNNKSPNTTRSIKSTVSLRKKGMSTEHKPRKKARSSSTSESSGCKQSTITRFFGKLVPDTSQVDGLSSAAAKQCPNSLDLPLSDALGSYKELDQFLQIINGNILRDDAASILEKAKGDVNLALDIHYSNRVGVSDNEEGSSKLCSTSVQTQCDIAGNESNRPEETANVPNVFAQGLSSRDMNATFVSLPLEKYCPVENACWRAGQPAPYLHLARTFDLVGGERGKIKATGMLCNMFRSLLALSPEDVLPAVYLCTNKIAADHENMELNIGGSLVSAALEEACGTNRSKIRDMYNNLGDLGDVAQLCRQTQSLLAPPHPLSIREVFAVLRKISTEAGSGSTVRKKNLVVNLMRSCREREMKFLVRTLVRNLRIGAMMRTILPALAQAVVLNSSPHLLCKGTPEDLKMQLQGICGAVVEAYNILPNLDLVVPSLLSKGIEFSPTTLSMMPGIPIRPMLARITNGINQVLKLFQGRAFTCEYKYDGQRAQIHKLMDGSVQVFSRNGEETTSRFPDLVNIVKESCKPAAMTFILDAEVVAVDRKNGSKLMAFQQLSSRERGSKDSLITMDSIKVDICVFIFDIMFANGEQLLAFSLRQRRRYLKDLFYEEKLGYFEFAKEITVEADESRLNDQGTLTKMNSFLEDAFNSSCEGIMVKSLDVDAGYTASKRTETWLKVKRDYLDGSNDTLDLVPIGAWHGNGRKAGWYSPFLMACFNPDTEEFQSVCRVMSGFSDSFYVEMKEFFSGEKILSKKPPYYQTAEVPDLWFSPELVWEIRGADFTISPVHQAAIGLVHPSRGISIRFPRFIRSVSDRKPEDCSTAADIADMFQSQTRKMEVSVDD
ncbi:DNA ligase 6 [Magnolia sinica]|uniref:DNA ligase 6 n=1 Tax=Magnolia sinica TaxID=86752 RepID=UPI002659D90C|nr:DNA ligase 6 [Magnolia sinica]